MLLKKKLIYSSLLLIGILLISISACKKDDVDDKEKDGNNIIYNTLTDSRDGNVYRTVQIGNQVWMAENLKYLPEVVGPAEASDTIPYYYVYGFDGTDVNDARSSAEYKTYGVLYNFPAAMGGTVGGNSGDSVVQGVCPSGWHLPSDDEWSILADYLGGESFAGGKLKESGTTNLESPNSGGTNESGFTALPGGYRDYVGDFYDIRTMGRWWTSSEQGNYAWNRYIINTNKDLYRTHSEKELGFSVRCIMD